MDSIPSFAAHEPSSEQLSRIAAQLLSEAALSPHGAVPAPLPAAPGAEAVLPATTAASAGSTGSLPVTPAAAFTHHVALPAQPFTPSIQPFAAATATPLRTASAPLEDFSGLRSFVARIRGSDAFARQSPPFDAPTTSAAAEVVGASKGGD